uniref:Seipin n=2 Tax=Lygus hesperus TaxID=30085 RepID=A0A0A9YH79_LYGHE
MISLGRYYSFKMINIVYKILNALGVIRRYDSLKNKTVKTTYDTIDAFFKIGLSVLFCLVLIWISVLFYVLFYYTYVPTIEHIKPVYLQFTSCDATYDKPSSRAVCGFPKAHVQLTRYNSLLMVGQPYKITVMMELPESESNKQLGMFMVCGQMVGKGGASVAHSCRSTMLRYRSPLLHVLRLFALGPFFVLNFMEEKQTLAVELFSNFEEDQNFPATDMYVELKSDRVEVYSAKVQIDAHLSGLRYIMFHWPFFSAVLGSIFNLGVIVFVMLLSWYKLYGPNNLTGESWEKEDSDNRSFTGDETVENVEEIEGKKCLILKEAEFEEETPQERKFVLERKLSSSDA